MKRETRARAARNGETESESEMRDCDRVEFEMLFDLCLLSSSESDAACGVLSSVLILNSDRTRHPHTLVSRCSGSACGVVAGPCARARVFWLCLCGYAYGAWAWAGAWGGVSLSAFRFVWALADGDAALCHSAHWCGESGASFGSALYGKSDFLSLTPSLSSKCGWNGGAAAARSHLLR